MHAVRSPNIVLIVADDMGFSDIGCYGSEISTPALDKLAKNGLRFSSMYNSARCCPSRASLLTGLYPHQAGIGHMVEDYGIPSPAYQGYLRQECVTIAEALKQGGYQTGMSGKWHVGGSYGIEPSTWMPGTQKFPTPRQRGFDHFFGTLAGAGSYYNPHTLMEGDSLVEIDVDKEFYYTDEITKHAVKMIEQFQQTAAPFFLYVAYTAPHWPLHAPVEEITKYRGTYLSGWDEIRKQRFARLKETGLISREWELSPRDDAAPPWEDANNKEWEDMRMAVYAAQIGCMDNGIGSIFAKLDDYSMTDNTLVIFLSDNGGCSELLQEEGWIENHVGSKRNGTPVAPGNDPKKMPGTEDTYMSYDLPWANVSNTPFRLYKHWVHEGGISTPCIVSWPEQLRERTRILHEPVHLIDIMATCLEVAGISYPDEYNGHQITPLEGESLVPLLEGGEWKRNNPIFWEHEGNCAIRDEEWKLVSQYPGNWELYNMAGDRTELHDLSEHYPEIVQAMEKQYQEWANRCGVLPWETIKTYIV